MLSLLDSGSMVSLVQHDNFDYFIRLKLGHAKGPEPSFHILFKLKGVNEDYI